MSDPITFNEVTKRYGALRAVDGLSFSVAEGSVTGLLGPNGAGKSTAMRLLLGIARTTSGACELLGARPGSHEHRDAMRRVGSHIESPALYMNATARQNLEIQATGFRISRRDPRIDRLLDTVGLAQRSEDRAKTFSLGMRQRLGLALALLNEPTLVVLDEPTIGLDPEGVVEIREIIRGLPAQGATVLVSSQVLAEVERTADRIVIISRGRLITVGSMQEVLAQATRPAFVVVVPEGDRARARTILERRGLAVDGTEGGALEVSGAIDAGSEVSRALAEANIYPDELRARRPDLEEAFLHVVGESDPAVSDRGEGSGAS